ncbi:ABC transporter ATP-binding protein [Frondihabitans peucedani]|uniref:ATP-binding cassette domain-containing protein n=1 Tax=Frondihabitans peucedani TaxID=598626 RepID=A0ABP8E2D9_9MICO
MRPTSIAVTALSKRYGDVVSVDSLTFRCEPGTVTAFLGPNGSGKSTSLRMIVGLTRPDSGTATFNGRTIRELDNPGRTVGVLLDAGAHHPGRSVAETLRLACILIGMPRTRISECLEFVGLEGVARRRVGTLSLGMRQRLGLAIAVLGEPACLLLDEPANGLDPEGISWLGDFLSEFASAGGTVLLSSHHLDDVDSVADHLVILDSGRMVHESSRSDDEMRRASTFTANAPEAITAELDRREIRWALDPASGRIEAATDPETIWHMSAESRTPMTSLTSSSPHALRDLFAASTTAEFQGGKLDFFPVDKREEAKK